MDKQDLRIIFLGNPEFARFHLETLLNNGFNVVAVISAADKAAGRGMKLHATPVTTYAREKGLAVLQPTNLKSPEFQKELESYQAHLQIVIAFRMLPEAVWNMPPMGTINLHASLLPQYRGAAPINWAIINGENETGVTTFRLKHEIDTGNILIQRSCPIYPDDNAGSLHDRLMHLGAQVTVDTLHGLLDGSLQEKEQAAFSDEEGLKKAPKIFTEDCKIDWTQHAADIYNFIRGLSPYPVAYTRLDDKRVKIFESTFETAEIHEPAGTWKAEGKQAVKIACADGYIYPRILQMEGKRKLPVEEFVKGVNL